MHKNIRILACSFFFLLTAQFSHAETGVSDTTITIGMSSPFSGPTGAYGSEMRDAINTLIEDTNREGGIYGRKIELITMDDGYETERAVANTKKLIEEKKVFALVGYYGSSPTTASMKIFSAAKVPLIGSISGADTLRSPVNRYMFNIRASYADETEAIIKQLTSMGLRNIAVFYQNDGFGLSGLEGVKTALKKRQLNVSAVGKVERNSLDVTSAVQTIAEAQPQAIIMVTLYKPTAEFVRQMKKAGQYPQYMTLSPVGADLLAKELGPAAKGIGISQVMPYPWNDTDSVVKSYTRAMKKKDPDFKPSYYGVEGYIAGRILIEGLKKAGKNIDREKFIDALEHEGNFNLGTYRIKYSPTSHNGSDFVDLTILGASGRVLH
jgi:branched-chain amino acid transport system substrate-binding protein